MLEYDRIDTAEGIDINKTSASKECDIFRYWYFLDNNFEYETISLQRLSSFNTKSYEF